jgi:hypothetical protein
MENSAPFFEWLKDWASGTTKEKKEDTPVIRKATAKRVGSIPTTTVSSTPGGPIYYTVRDLRPDFEANPPNASSDPISFEERMRRVQDELLNRERNSR